METGVYGDLIMIYPKPYSIYLRGTRGLAATPPNLQSEMLSPGCSYKVGFEFPSAEFFQELEDSFRVKSLGLWGLGLWV